MVAASFLRFVVSKLDSCACSRAHHTPEDSESGESIFDIRSIGSTFRSIVSGDFYYYGRFYYALDIRSCSCCCFFIIYITTRVVCVVV